MANAADTTQEREQMLAASMDVAETTFHYHLRNALETLSSALIGLEKRWEY